MTSYLTQLLFSATLLLLAAITVSLFIHRRSASFRYKFWYLTLLMLLWFPFLVILVPASLSPPLPYGMLGFIPEKTEPVPMQQVLEVPLRDINPYSTADKAAVDEWERLWLVDSPVVKTEVAKQVVVVPQKASLDFSARLPTILSYLWFGGTLLLTLRLFFSSLAARRLLSKMSPVERDALNTLVRELSQQLGIRKPVVLLQSEVGTVPFTLGTWKPKIVLPRTMIENRTDSELRTILTHELAHVRRGDVQGQRIAQWVSCLYWFHPLVWFATGRLRLERELACDDLVLLGGEEPAEYAEILLDLANTFPVCNRHALGCGVAMFQRKNIVKRRIASILNKKVCRVPVGRIGSGVLLLLVLAGVTLASLVSPYEDSQSDTVLLRKIRQHMAKLEPSPAEKAAIAELRQKVFDDFRRNASEENPAEKAVLDENEQIVLDFRFCTISEPLGSAVMSHKAMCWTGMPLPEARTSSELVPFQQEPQPGLCTLSSAAPMPLHVRYLDLEHARTFVEIYKHFRQANVLMAPKVTFFNGQSWHICDVTETPFVTSVIPLDENGVTAYEPILQKFHSGSNIRGGATLLEDGSCRIDHCVAEISQVDGADIVRFQSEDSISVRGTAERSGVSLQVPNVRSLSISIPRIKVPENMSLLVTAPGIAKTTDGECLFLMITPKRVPLD